MRILHLMLAIFCMGVATSAWSAPEKTEKLASELRPNDVIQETLNVIYSGNETMHYAVSWSGGVKIGDIYLAIRKAPNNKEGYVIDARVKDYGPLSVFYPVDDQFRCFVDGKMKLPTRYEVKQKEGLSGRKTTRLSRYDQTKKVVRYQKNQNEAKTYQIDGQVYNEFASFVITRALAFIGKVAIIVPTFADEKRHEVKVAVADREVRHTLFGEIKTLKVQPKMEFKGLYEKSGNTTLWLTDDRCRVPVEIHSRIVVGSLVAELVEYSNSACPERRIEKKK